MYHSFPRSVTGATPLPAIANLHRCADYLLFLTSLLPGPDISTSKAHMVDIIGPLWAVAYAVYEAVQNVKDNYQECVAIQNAVLGLVKVLKSCNTISDALQDHIRTMTTTFQALVRTLRTLSGHSYFYRILHRRSIRSILKDARRELERATTLFQVGAQASLLDLMSELQGSVRKITDAQRVDESAAEARYVELLRSSEDEMFETLGLNANAMPEAMVALLKHMKDMPEGLEKRCCERGIDAMRRRTGEVVVRTDDFSLSSYEVVIHKKDKLGSGGFAQVYRGTYRDGRTVAVKVLAQGAPPSALRQEVDVWKTLSHVNVLEFIGVCTTVDPPFMVCAYKANGNAIDYLCNNPTASRHRLLYEASKGLVYLHEKRIIHGDIKATNILIDADGTACLSDFGLSRAKRETTMALNLSLEPQRGTIRWMAPEQLGGSSASWKTDVYSFAMTIYETFTGRPPFADHDDGLIYRMVHDNGKRPPYSDVKEDVRALGLNSAMWALIEHCWEQDPRKRWSATQLSECLRQLLHAKPESNQVNAPVTPLLPAVKKSVASPRVNAPMAPPLVALGRNVSDFGAHPPRGFGPFLQDKPSWPGSLPAVRPHTGPVVIQKQLPSLLPVDSIRGTKDQSPSRPSLAPNPSLFPIAAASSDALSADEEFPDPPSPVFPDLHNSPHIVVAEAGLFVGTSPPYSEEHHAYPTDVTTRGTVFESMQSSTMVSSSSEDKGRPAHDTLDSLTSAAHSPTGPVTPLPIGLSQLPPQLDWSSSNPWQDFEPPNGFDASVEASSSYFPSDKGTLPGSETSAISQSPKTTLADTPSALPTRPDSPSLYDDPPSPPGEVQCPFTPSDSPVYPVTHVRKHRELGANTSK